MNSIRINSKSHPFQDRLIQRQHCNSRQGALLIRVTQVFVDKVSQYVDCTTVQTNMVNARRILRLLCGCQKHKIKNGNLWTVQYKTVLILFNLYEFNEHTIGGLLFYVVCAAAIRLLVKTHDL